MNFENWGIDQFGFKNIISLHPPYLGGFQEHDKRWVFRTMYCFSSGTGVCLGHCIIFCLSWKPPRYGGRHALETELVYRPTYHLSLFLAILKLLNPKILSTKPHQNVVWYNNSWLGFLKIRRNNLQILKLATYTKIEDHYSRCKLATF